MERAKKPWTRRLAGWAAPLLLIPAALAVLWLELVPARAGPLAPERPVAVSARPLAGSGSRIGPFTLLAGLELGSDDADFGGLSGLAAAGNGQIVAITDAGQWLGFAPVLADGRLVGVAGARMAGLVDGETKADRDAEAVVLLPDGGMLISMEQQHRILVMAGQRPPFRPLPTIFHTLAASWPRNGGGESLARLPDGQLLWLSEDARRPDGLAVALLWRPGQPPRAIGVPVPAGFAPTDITVLDDHRLLALHRKFDGTTVAAAITLVDLAPVLAGGAAATSTELARWGPGGPWPVDNMEGLTLVRDGARTIVYVCSDDNFNRAQRSLLLQLELAD